MAVYNPQEIEKKVLEFWKKHKIFEKLRKKNHGKKRWSFIDGPITANNPMGVHHAWGRTYKDFFQRFKAMNGFEMRYQNGFDCQGLWVEREEEKELGLKDKKDIEKFGILNFVKSCRKRVEKFSKVQAEQSIRLGEWMDWDNSYYTMSDNNQLHNWHLIKEYHKKGWIYKGKDAVPWCWRCGTASSKHDIATEGYKEVTHPALFMQFPLKENPDEYFLIFTTTPWTVPANVAIAVNEKITYVKVENQGVKYWLAEKRINELEGDYKILERKKGKALAGKEYIMPYAQLEPQAGAPHKVLLWELASEEEGTGIVHIAPGCGKEDFDLGKIEKLPAISPLDELGVYTDGFGEFSLKKYSEVNKEVLNDLEQRRFLYKTAPYKHRYPHCFRCGEELVFRMVDEWYIKCSGMREPLIKANKTIKWYPEYAQKRQEDWFNNMSDWLISRKRYWGLPLPIWMCSDAKCKHFEVIGSLKELKEKAFGKEDKEKVDKLPEIHRPWIDEIKIKCEKCGKSSERIKDVGDAWLDAGIVMFSTLDYLNKKDYWKEWYPADFITENLPGQYRGWFNAIMWAGVALTGRSPFKSLFGYETLKDEKGNEMHKSKGNAIWFDDAVNKAGADPIRLLYCLQDPSQELRFGFNVLKEPTNSLNILFNMSRLVEKSKKIKKYTKIEDKWILSKFNSTIKLATDEINRMHPHLASRAIQNFWLNDFSRGYIQLVRDRISSEDEDVLGLINEIYINLLKLAAPITPFITEEIWQGLKERKLVDEESVHLCSWPIADEKLIDKKLEEEFIGLFKILEKGLAERDAKQIGLKWPLSSAKINLIDEIKVGKELVEIIKRQLNVKNIDIKKAKEFSVELDLKMTPELEAEGFSREIARAVQAERKKMGLVKSDLISLEIFTEDKTAEMLKKHEDFIKERTNSKKISITKDSPSNKSKCVEIKVKDKKFHLFLTK